ncbi:hypothetical protein N752_14815 [Desulforamulus aquiferis]|nr:hypothetical protein [Desulforamulus aquiferis]RYD04641.1 hypothetical protein N752_14815 [Desulforamulus aquiferis]
MKCQVTVYLGAKDKKSLLCDGQFEQMEAEVVIATDDGSLGYKAQCQGDEQTRGLEKDCHHLYVWT